MQESVEVTPSTNCRKRKKRTSFRFSTMKELKKAREYKSKKKLITKEPSGVQKTLKYPKRAQKQQDSKKVAHPWDGYQIPEQRILVVGGEDEEEAREEGEDDNLRDDEIEVRVFGTSWSNWVIWIFSLLIWVFGRDIYLIGRTDTGRGYNVGSLVSFSICEGMD
jgi:hypothetical protein